jgi:hypothetical protein
MSIPVELVVVNENFALIRLLDGVLRTVRISNLTFFRGKIFLKVPSGSITK